MNDSNLKKKILISVFLVLILTACSFYPSLRNDFTNLDDNGYVTENPMIKSLSPGNVGKIFTSSYYTSYHPLTTMSFAIEYHFFKLDPFIYHLTNLIFHLLNTLLVFWFIFIISGKIHSSLIVSALFGIHPLHVESVAWISARKDVLSTFFFLGAIITYLYHRKFLSVKFYYLSLFIFILSLLSKPMGITLPFILLLCDYILARRIDKKAFMEKIPFLLLSLLFIFVTLGSFSDQRAPASFKNLLIASYGIVFYIIKTIAPVYLSAIYPYPEKDFSKLPAFLISPLVVVFFLGLIIFSRRYTKKVIFGGLFFLITLLPVLQIVPNSIGITADRYTYIPLIGIFYIIGEGFSWLYSHIKIMKVFLIIIFILLTGTLSFLTYQRCKIWSDSLTLWNDILKNHPTYGYAYHGRGNSYLSLGEYDKAILDYNVAIKINPGIVKNHINRGNAYKNKGEYDKAILDYNMAIKIDPASAESYNNRGNIHKAKGEYDKAILDYNQALLLEPDNAGFYNNRGNIYLERGEYDKAILDFSQAIKLNPGYSETYYNRALIYELKEEYDEALADYDETIKLNPNYAEACINRGNVYYKKGDYDKAINDYDRAIALKPNSPVAYTARGNTYFDKGDYKKALADYDQAIKIDPNFAAVYNERGIFYGSLKEYDKAILDFNQALLLNPNYIEPYYNRAMTYTKIKKYDEAWKDVKKIQSMGYQIAPEFLEKLRKASGRE